MRPIIIGAGPIGSFTAKQIEKLNPILIEARKQVGKPVQCTGLMSTRLRKITPYPEEIILNKVKGAKLFSTNNESIINAQRVMAHVIDRTAYDQWMLEQYKGEAHLGEKFINYDNKIVKTNKRKYKTNLLINCSGPRKGLLGVQAIAPLKKDNDFVELHFNECPGFFTWVVPEGNGNCRIGLASKNNSMQMLKRFLTKIKAGKVSEWQAGMIPMQVSEFIKDNQVSCGDAAGHVKALSGGGVVTGLLSSIVMSESIIKSFKANDYSKKFFKKNYYTPWSKSVGKELRLHAKARKFLNKTDYDELLEFINKNKKVFENYGDMDFLSRFVFKLIKPENLKFIIKSLWKFIFA